MEIFIAVILLCVALFLVVKGGDIFVSSAGELAKRANIPQIIFGATVVSLCTTLPELIISIITGINKTTGLAVGDAVGSVLCNMGLVCGIAFCVKSIDMKRGGVFKYYLNMLTVIVVFVICLFLKVELWQGFVLIGIAALFFVCNYIDSLSLDKNNGLTKKQEQKLKPLWLDIILFIVGALAIGGGAYLLTDKVEYLAKIIGVSDVFIGITIVGIGTSLPELITVISAIKEDSPYLAIGNIVGSNILNLSLILGAARIASWDTNVLITKETAYISMPLALVFSMLLILPIFLGKKTYKWQGIIFLSFYAIYLAYLVFSAVYKFI